MIALVIWFGGKDVIRGRSEEHTSELQSRFDLVCRLLLEIRKRAVDDVPEVRGLGRVGGVPGPDARPRVAVVTYPVAPPLPAPQGVRRRRSGSTEALRRLL